jgi:hypothetical protein
LRRSFGEADGDYVQELVLIMALQVIRTAGAGFKPGSFFNTVTYNSGPIAANVSFTYRS